MKKLIFAIFFLTFAAPSFAGEKPAEHFGRSRSFRLHSVQLNLDVDIRGQQISGVSKMLFSPIQKNVESLEIDSVDLEILKTEIDGISTPFEKTPDKILLKIKPRSVGQIFSIAISYRGRPKKGIYFVAPNSAYPKRPYQAWTQGQSEDSRFWFPVYDYPNERATSEMFVRVDSDFTAVSNGKRLEATQVGKKKQFHFKEDVPHSTYLISLAAGQFDTAQDKVGDIPLEYYVRPGTKNRIPHVFGNTALMVNAFEEISGVKYPYAKYAQVVVENFTHSGMENISATTLNDYVLYPESEKSAWQKRVDGLLAHELAHQWYGDLITCESWSDAWLNEGFATYLQALAFGKIYGADETLWEFSRLASEIIAGGNKKATVRYNYGEPGGIFDETIYARGAWILHMLRNEMGDDLFLKGLRAYTKEFAAKTVVTSDFQRSMEKSSGLDLSEFFQKWVYRGGYLNLTATWSWDADANSAVVSLKQDPIEGTTDKFYNVDIPIQIETKTGVEKKTIALKDSSTKIMIPFAEKPKTVRVDPEMRWLRKLNFERPLEELQNDVDPKKPILVRLHATNVLGKNRSRESIATLGNLLRSDPFWGVRRIAASALGEVALPESYDELLKSFNSAEVPIQKSILSALREDRRESTRKQIRAILQKNPNPSVVADGAFILAYQRSEADLPLLRKLLLRPAHQETIADSIMNGIADSGWLAGYNLAKERSRYGTPQNSRPAAVRAVGEIGKVQTDTEPYFEFLVPLTDDPWFRVRSAAAKALAALGNEKAETILERMKQSDVDSIVRERASTALDTFRENRKSKGNVEEIRKKVKELESSQEEMKKRIEFIESQKAAPKKSK